MQTAINLTNADGNVQRLVLEEKKPACLVAKLGTKAKSESVTPR